MKISIIVPGRWHSFELAARLQQAGLLEKIITTYPKSRTRLWNIRDEHVISLPTHLILTKMAWKIGGEKLAMRLQFRINDIFATKAQKYLKGANIIHAWSGSAEPSVKAAKVSFTPIILERSSAHMEEQYRLLLEEYSKLGLKWEPTPVLTVERELREYQLADSIAVPSQFVARTFYQRGIGNEKIFLNPLGVDIKHFSPGIKKDSVFRVIYAGNVGVRKGIHILVKAFNLANIPKAELVLVGGITTESATVTKEAGPWLKMLGHRPQSELKIHYANASVFVLPSIEDGFGMVITQALSCGLPIICSSNTGGEDILCLSGSAKNHANDLVREYPAGYVVQVGRPDLIAYCLNELQSKPNLLVDKKNAALKLRNDEMSWDAYANRAIKHYDKLLSKTSKKHV